jgi:transglutaminase-like putative cysteine protease
MRFLIRHVTRYQYAQRVSHAHHLAHLVPRDTPRQRLVHSELRVDPLPALRRTYADYFGNVTDRFELRDPHRLLQVVCESEVVVEPRAPATSVGSWEDWARALADRAPRDVEFCFDSPLVRAHAELRSFAEPSFPSGGDLIDAVVDLNRRIHREFRYRPGATEVSTPLAEVMRRREGVCQDFAHVAVGCLRSLGLPARYVSGYLETRPPPGRPRLVGADASHAWASVLLPSGTWFDFDPTNDVLPDERHVTVAWGRDFSDVSPLRGIVLGGGEHAVQVSVDTAPLDAA